MTKIEAFGLAYARDIHTGGRLTDPIRLCQEVNFIHGDAPREVALLDFPPFLTESTERSDVKADYVQTPFNLDHVCRYDPEPREGIFSEAENPDLLADLFEEHCFEQNSCTITTD